jgi:hypothetical protein
MLLFFCCFLQRQREPDSPHSGTQRPPRAPMPPPPKKLRRALCRRRLTGFPGLRLPWPHCAYRFAELISVRPEVRYEYAFSARPYDNGTRRGQLMFAIDANRRF